MSTATYVFTTPDGRRVSGHQSMGDKHGPQIGDAADVRYLAMWPEINAIGRPLYGNFAFLAWLG